MNMNAWKKNIWNDDKISVVALLYHSKFSTFLSHLFRTDDTSCKCAYNVIYSNFKEV